MKRKEDELTKAPRTPSLDDFLSDHLKIAADHGACGPSLQSLEQFPEGTTLRDLRDHERAPYWASWYTEEVLQDRWPDAEKVILQDAFCAHLYARGVVKSRWPEAEPVIVKQANAAYLYARDVIKAPWPEAEPVFLQSPEWVYLYARDVIKAPWPEAEPVIKRSTLYRSLYEEHFGVAL